MARFECFPEVAPRVPRTEPRAESVGRTIPYGFFERRSWLRSTFVTVMEGSTCTLVQQLALENCVAM